MTHQNKDIEVKTDFNGNEFTVEYDKDGREISYTSKYFTQTTTYDGDGTPTYTDQWGNIEFGQTVNFLKAA